MKTYDEIVARIEEMLKKGVLIQEDQYSQAYSTGYYNALRWVVDEDNENVSTLN